MNFAVTADGAGVACSFSRCCGAVRRDRAVRVEGSEEDMKTHVDCTCYFRFDHLDSAEDSARSEGIMSAPPLSPDVVITVDSAGKPVTMMVVRVSLWTVARM